MFFIVEAELLVNSSVLVLGKMLSCIMADNLSNYTFGFNV